MMPAAADGTVVVGTEDVDDEEDVDAPADVDDVDEEVDVVVVEELGAGTSTTTPIVPFVWCGKVVPVWSVLTGDGIRLTATMITIRATTMRAIPITGRSATALERSGRSARSGRS
jgi:hypothetical protein